MTSVVEPKASKYVITAIGAALTLVLTLVNTTAQQSVPADLSSRVDALVMDVMAKTSVPSATIGIVVGGQVVLTKAYGSARLEPNWPATVDLHYPIGSISKQFTAACVLLLQEEKKLSIDDPLAKYLPELTRANEVTLRNLLSHTSGYPDYAPQDYTIPAWTKPTTTAAIVREWATKPLDFEPGTEFQYSNTNFKIAGLIVEKVGGEPFWQYLTRRVLRPLGMNHTIDLDTEQHLVEPVGYMRHAFGPLRPAIPEAPGWLFADGEMAMPVRDLLAWDISVMSRSLLSQASYLAMETDTKLKTGATAGYGLGVSVSVRDSHRVVSHGGEVGGFVAQNIVFPDDKIAIAVLTNQEASAAAAAIAGAITRVLVSAASGASGTSAADTAKAEAQTKQILAALAAGSIDRSLFTDNANFFFDETALGDYKTSLVPLGGIKTLMQSSTTLRGGMRFRIFDVTFGNGVTGRITTYTTTDGKLEQFLLDAVS